MAVKLKANRREDLKQSATKQLRKSGLVPGIVYGEGLETKTISVDSIELIKTVRDEGRNAIISLNIEEDQPVEVMLHEYQMDSIRDELLHVDFYKVDLTEKMDVEVTLRLEGDAEGTKEGGILQQPLYELQVRAIPSAIPEEITIDVTDLAIGDVITIDELPKTDDYEYLDEADTAIAIVLPPEEEEEEVEVPVDPTVEPELVGEEDEDEEIDEN